jgi:hypothetical protein
VKTRHHKIPKCFKHNRQRFFNLNAKPNVVMISEQEHRAWNLLTHNSQMTLGETLQSLRRFLPDNVALTATIK